MWGLVKIQNHTWHAYSNDITANDLVTLTVIFGLKNSYFIAYGGILFPKHIVIFLNMSCRWDDGSAFNYQKWKENEPNDYGGEERCVAMNRHTGKGKH